MSVPFMVYYAFLSFAFCSAISAFISFISMASFSSHSSLVGAYMFLAIRLPYASFGEYLPSYRWSFILLMHPVPGFLILPFLGSNLACGGFACSFVIVSSVPSVYLLNRALIFYAASFFISSVLCRYISSVVLLDTCPRMVDKVLMSIPFATDVVAKVWRRS